MPLDTSIYQNLNTRLPEQLSDLLNPVNIQEKQNKLSDLANQRQMDMLNLQNQQRQMARAPILEQRADAEYATQQNLAKQKQITDLQRNSARFALENGATDDAIKQASMLMVQGGMDQNKVTQSMNNLLAMPLPERQRHIGMMLMSQEELGKRMVPEFQKPESTLAKIDPKDYTPESFKMWFKGGMKDPSLLIAKSADQLPPAALKMQTEAIDAVGALSSLNADLGTIKSNLETGALDLGMFSNLINKARNYGGLSTEESRNLATFQSTLERLRNESLRLNKGVQTEGDAIRSWNEILANINDPQLVKQRLEEVMATNQRAVELRKLEVDNIRSNYGLDPLDLTAQQSVKPALTKTRGATGDFGGGNSVTAPDGSIHNFPSKAAADAFRKAIGQ